MSAVVASWLSVSRGMLVDRACWRADGQAKHIYPSRKRARRAAKRMARNTGKRMTEYRCERHGWHVGSLA